VFLVTSISAALRVVVMQLYNTVNRCNIVGAGTRGIGVITCFGGLGMRSHTFLVTILQEDVYFCSDFLCVAPDVA